MGNCEFQGATIPLPVDSFLNIQPLQLQVWPILIGMIIYRFTHFKDEILDVVILKDVSFPVIKMYIKTIIEEHLGIDSYHRNAGITSSYLISYASIEILEFSFCLFDMLETDTHPRDIVCPVPF